MSTDSNVYIPAVDPLYVPWGDHDFIRSIIDRGQFFPVYVAGSSGTGKSIMVEQVCAELGRRFCRIQVTPETDEDQLIGGIRLKDGDTVFQDGPVIEAMRTGSVLLIDEIDRGSNKIMCLQGVMEGKPVVIKRTGEVVHPAPGFTVVATGNTKGRGDDSGKYIAAVIIDDAFLERFPVVINHDYPSEYFETKILQNHMKKFNCEDEVVLSALIRWARKTRGQDEDAVISTRRVCLIAESFSFFKDREDGDVTAVTYGTNRFDEVDQMALLASYNSIRPDIISEKQAAERQRELEEATSTVDDDEAAAIAAGIMRDFEESQNL